MATAPSEGFWQRRGVFNVYELLQSWWRHRISFLISVAITVAALALYYLTFLGERPTPIFSFLQRLEFDCGIGLGGEGLQRLDDTAKGIVEIEPLAQRQVLAHLHPTER